MKQIKVLVVLLVGLALLGACAQQKIPPPSRPEFQSIGVEAGYTQKVENFLILLDASSSMFSRDPREWFQGPAKIDQAKENIINMTATMPELKLQSGLRVFGPVAGAGAAASDNRLILGMAAYNRGAFLGVLQSVHPAGLTPIAKPLAAVADDLKGGEGRTAVVLISDGVDTGRDDPVAVARALKAGLGDRLCLYTVLVGSDPVGQKRLADIAAASGCGFSTTAESLAAEPAMADFVRRVFLEKAKAVRLDSDRDGVFDDLDRCPGTPLGVRVDAAGCPPDHDRDGVRDDLDRCPDTPLGAMVDGDGCPPKPMTFNLNVEFVVARDEVKRGYHDHLKEFADYLNDHPQATAVLEGHTDNTGGAGFNLELSRRRAAAVKRYLVDGFGIDGNRLTVRGYGMTRPIASNVTASGRRQNRRVTAVVTGPSSR